jgi:hypothetical protein
LPLVCCSESRRWEENEVPFHLRGLLWWSHPDLALEWHDAVDLKKAARRLRIRTRERCHVRVKSWG